jgi:hypothetical protein
MATGCLSHIEELPLLKMTTFPSANRLASERGPSSQAARFRNIPVARSVMVAALTAAKVSPLYFAVLSWALTLGCFGLGELLIDTFGSRGGVPQVIGVLVTIAAMAPVLATLMFGASYRHNAATIPRIIGLYLALVALSAYINFLLVLHFGRRGTPRSKASARCRALPM